MYLLHSSFLVTILVISGRRVVSVDAALIAQLFDSFILLREAVVHFLSVCVERVGQLVDLRM